MNNYINYNVKKSNLALKHSFRLIFQKIETMFFVILSLILVITSKIQPNFNAKISNIVVNVSTPISSFVVWPFNTGIYLVTSFNELVKAKEENQVLKKQINELNQYYLNSLSIYEENRELRNALNFVKPRLQNYQMAEVIGFSQSVFNNSLIINTAKDSQIKLGQIVLGKRGVVGRIESFDADTKKSRVLLATDSRSKIPIITAHSRNRGILAGINNDMMEILYLSKNHRVEVKDKVYTSGDGDTLPSGLLIGVVEKVDKNSVFVAPVERISDLNTVTIVNY
jgi:rod shape-determining protein MreC